MAIQDPWAGFEPVEQAAPTPAPVTVGTPRPERLTPYQRRQLALAERAADRADRAEARAGQTAQGGGEVNAQTRGQARAKVAAARSLRQQLDRVEQIFAQRFEGRRSPLEFLPTAGNHEFDAAIDGMMPLARQAFRVPGSGADTEREGIYLERILPDRWSYDETNRQRINQLRQMIDEVEREYGPIAGIPQAPQRGQMRVVRRRRAGQ